MKIYGFIRSVKRLYQSQQVRHAIKTAIAAILMVIVNRFFNLPHGFWAVITAIIIMQSNMDSGSFETTLKTAFERLVGTLSGAMIGFSLFLLFTPNYWQLLIIMFLAIFLCSFLANLYVGFRLSGPTAAIILLLSNHAPITQNVAFTRFIEIFLGALSAIIVTLFIWPYRVTDYLKNHRKKVLRLITHQLSGLVLICYGKSMRPNWFKTQEQLIALIRQERSYIKMLKKELQPEANNKFNTELRLATLISRLGEVLPRLPQSYWEYPLLREQTLCLIRMFAHTIRNLTKKKPLRQAFNGKIADEYFQTFQSLRVSRRQMQLSAVNIEEIYRIFTTSQALRECSDITKIMDESLIENSTHE